MIYYSHIAEELSQTGIQEGELAIYTGTFNPMQSGTLGGLVLSAKSAHIFLWQDGRDQELSACFQRDEADLDVLEVRAEEEEYVFLRDRPSGYIRQVSGPAKPIVIANFGAIPLRADTLLGKFTVYAGTALRLDESAPRREKRKIRLTLRPDCRKPLKSAELWDGSSWRRLNIREEPPSFGRERRLTVLDGSAVVQSLSVNEKREILMLDAPETDPDYEIYAAAQPGDQVTLRFNRADYRDGQVVQRVRGMRFSRWGEPVVYALQKLRESLTQSEADRCTAELPGPPSTCEGDPASEERTPPMLSDKLRKFLDGDHEPGGTALPPSEAGPHEAPGPEPPEEFLRL